VWRLAENADVFGAVTSGLAALTTDLTPDAIAGIETRGVLFGAPVARTLGLGFHTIRKSEGLFAGAVDSIVADADYRGKTHRLRSRAVFGRGQRVVLIDDWIERGSQARAACSLIERAGAVLAGVVVIVDDSDGSLPVASLIRGDELPGSVSP
jgi:adenine phosphoribosyltransferase